MVTTETKKVIQPSPTQQTASGSQVAPITAATEIVKTDNISLVKASLNKDWKGVSELTRATFVAHLCHALQIPYPLNPFRFIDMKGITVLYADKRAAALIGNANKISIEILKEVYDKEKQILKIYVRASKPDGVFSDEYAALHIGSKNGEDRANAEMKCLTKAKRRGVLALVDMAIPDEDEVRYLEEATKQNQLSAVKEEEIQHLETVDPITDQNDVKEARSEVMDLITGGIPAKMEAMKKFIADHTEGKELKDLTYDECHSVMARYEDYLQAEKQKPAQQAAVVTSVSKAPPITAPSEDNEDPGLWPSPENNSGL